MKAFAMLQTLLLFQGSKEQKKNQYDPRYYYIGINSLILFKQPSTQVSILFTLGTKKSESKYDKKEDLIMCNEGFRLKDEAVERQVHLLKYGAEELLNINVKIEKNSMSLSRILLAPIIELPHTRHNLNIKLFQNLFENSQSSTQVTALGELNIDIYFQFDFSGRLDVIPVSAHLQRNSTQLGEMKPRVRLQMEQEKWISLEAEGGIHPHWTGHFHANRKNNKGLIESIDENLKINKLEQQQRILKMATSSLEHKQGGTHEKNEKKQQHGAPYFDCTSFPMHSAGSFLQVEIISDQFIGNEKEINGAAKIRVADEGCLKFPRKASQKLFQKKLVQLYHYDFVVGNYVPVGVLKLYFRFVFDKEKIVKKNRSYQLI